MTPNDFDTLFAYSDACREQLRIVLRKHEELFTKPFATTSKYNSIQKLLAHCVGAEERWLLRRIKGESLPVIYEERVSDTLEGLFTDAQTIRQAINNFRGELTENDYRRVISISLPQRETPLDLSLSDIFFHIINHENYHRGQVITLLQQNGVEPPDFDYVLWKPDRSL